MILFLLFVRCVPYQIIVNKLTIYKYDRRLLQLRIYTHGEDHLLSRPGRRQAELMDADGHAISGDSITTLCWNLEDILW